MRWWLAVGLGAVALVGAAPGAPAAACAPGQLVFSAPYLPSAVVLSPKGDDLILVDRGALTVRDPATLQVKRTLLPTIDHWSRAFVSADGALVWAETVDGLRFTFDTATWTPKRLADDRGVAPGRGVERDHEFWFGLKTQGTAALLRAEEGFWESFRARLGLAALPAGGKAAAVAFGVVRTRDGRQVLDPLDPIAPGNDPTPFRLVVADAGGTIHIYDDRKEIAAGAALAGAHVVDADISGGRILVALASGEVVVLRPDLSIEARALVRAPAGSHGLMSLQYDPARRRIAWVSTDHAVGVFDVGARQALAEIQGTGAGLLDALFVDERRVALLTDQRAMLWDTATGTATAARPGAYRTMVPAGGGLLAVTTDGAGEVLDGKTLSVRRRICFLPQGCEVPPPQRPQGMSDADWSRLSDEQRRRVAEVTRLPDDRRFEAASREVHAALSPDGRSLAVLHPPLQMNERRSPGSLALWDTRTLTEGREVAIDDCYAWEIAYQSRGVLDVCGKQRRDAATLAVLGGEPPRADPVRDWGKPERTPLRRAEVNVLRQQEGDMIWVIGEAKKGLLDIALPERKGNSLETKSEDQDRLQLRGRTIVAAAPGGRRFLLAGRGIVKETWFPGFEQAAGALQVWCTPDRPVEQRALPVPDDPPAAEFDGVAERALDGFPEKIVAAAEAGEAAFVLGTDGKGGAQTLVSVGADASRAAPQPLPPGGPWQQLVPSPGGETVWLQGKGTVARRNHDGSWTAFSLDLAPQASTLVFAPFSAEAAVHVAVHGCSAAENAAAKAEANLRSYYDYNPTRFVIPRRVEASQIELMADVSGPDDRAGRDWLRRRSDVVAGLLGAPGADFAAIQARAVKDPKITASPTLKLSLVEGQVPSYDRPLERLFRGRPGEVLGPISTRVTDAYGTHERLFVRFVHIEAVSPPGRHPFSELAQHAAANQWWPFAEGMDCADLTVLGVRSPVRRTVLPPHAVREVVAWSGGFGVAGNPLLVFRDGGWVSPSAPLAAAVGALRKGEALGAGTSIYVRRPGGDLDVIDPAAARPVRTVALGEHTGVATVQARAGGGETIWAIIPGAADRTVLAVDARGTTKDLGPARIPVWAGPGSGVLVPGQSGRTFTTDLALIRRDGDRWTAVFNPAARRRGLSARRRADAE